jgi:hypothetical protein
MPFAIERGTLRIYSDICEILVPFDGSPASAPVSLHASKTELRAQKAWERLESCGQDCILLAGFQPAFFRLEPRTSKERR